MATVKVYAPNPDHSGITAGVQFRRGVGEVDEGAAGSLACLLRHGYSIGAPIEPSDDASDADVEPDSVPVDGVPPKAGPGSGLEAWVAYANSIGVDTEGLGRAEIIGAVEDHLGQGEPKAEDGEPAEDGEDTNSVDEDSDEPSDDASDADVEPDSE